MVKLYFLFKLDDGIIKLQFLCLFAGFELVRKSPCLYLMVLFANSLSSNVKSECCIFTHVVMVENVVSSCEDDVLGDEYATAYVEFLIFVKKSQSSDRAMKCFFELFSFYLE